MDLPAENEPLNNENEPGFEVMPEQAGLITEVDCPHCGRKINPTDKFCINCGYPQNGSEEEKTDFNNKIGYQKLLLQEADRKIRNSRIYLYLLAGLYALVGICTYLFSKDAETNGTAILIASLIVAAINVGLAYYANQRPFMSLLIALGFYLMLNVLSAIVDPKTLYQGILIKVLLISALITGIRSAYKAEKIKKEFSIQ